VIAENLKTWIRKKVKQGWYDEDFMRESLERQDGALEIFDEFLNQNLYFYEDVAIDCLKVVLKEVEDGRNRS